MKQITFSICYDCFWEFILSEYPEDYSIFVIGSMADATDPGDGLRFGVTIFFETTMGEGSLATTILQGK